MSPGADLRVEPMRARERPASEMAALFAGGWPAFIESDDLATRYLPTVRATFGHLEVAVLRSDSLVGAGWGVPVAWDGGPSTLPGGYSDALERAVRGHQAALTPDTLVVCAAQVRPDAVRSGIAVAILAGLIEAAEAAGLAKVVAPLRPTAKHRYPLTAIESYAAWRRADGSAFDPWIRTHLRMGGRILGTRPASQTFTGTVQQWEQWSGFDLPGDGAYIVPDALAPLHIDRAANVGTCVEPTVWVRHR